MSIVNQDISLRVISVTGDSTSGFNWREYYDVEIMGGFLFMEINRTVKSGENIAVNIKILSKDSTTFFERCGDGLDGTILEELKNSLMISSELKFRSKAILIEDIYALQ
jgi:hypothetical protein